MVYKNKPKPNCPKCGYPMRRYKTIKGYKLVCDNCHIVSYGYSWKPMVLVKGEWRKPDEQ